ncbi:MAG: 16S rRNA (guanine(966)-N(2))-methyltransferase RsmD [Beijerinckiaceae bacterium]
MRVVGGSFKGRALKGPATQAVRPTSDRLRESIFNILAHAYDDPCEGARVIDLFAGTGALAIEALSRGASFALLVDDSAEGRGLIRANIETLGLGGVTRVFRRDATKLGQMPPQEPFTLAFLDPPYGKGLGEKALEALRDGGWLADGALVVFEESADAEIALPEGYELLERREYGESAVMVARVG